MDCRNFQENIGRYLGVDLKGQDLRDFESHLSVCKSCQKVLQQERVLEKVLRDNIKPQEAPFDLRQSVLESLEKPQAPNPFAGLVALFKRPYFVGALVVSALVVIGVNVMIPKTAVVSKAFDDEDLIRQHEILVDRLPGMKFGDPNIFHVTNMLSRELGYHVARPHLNLKKVTFVGAKIVEVNGRQVAQLIYKKDNEVISAFALPPGMDLDKFTGHVMVDGNDVRVVASNSGGFEQMLCFHKEKKDGCFFVSNIPRDEFYKLIG